MNRFQKASSSTLTIRPISRGKLPSSLGGRRVLVTEPVTHSSPTASRSSSSSQYRKRWSMAQSRLSRKRWARRQPRRSHGWSATFQTVCYFGALPDDFSSCKTHSGSRGLCTPFRIVSVLGLVSQRSNADSKFSIGKKVKQTADKIASSTDRIDILINNAARGIMTYQLTDYGVDRHVSPTLFLLWKMY